MSCSESPDTLFKISTKTRNSYSLYWNKQWNRQNWTLVELHVVNVLIERFCLIFSADLLFNGDQRTGRHKILNTFNIIEIFYEAVRASLLFRFSSSCFFWCNHTIMIIPIRIIVPIKIAINFFVKSFILSVYLREISANGDFWQKLTID